MVYSFARIGAVLSMRVDDYYLRGRRPWMRLHEKGGRYHEVPVHHNADEYLHHYITLANIGQEKSLPLFRSATTNGEKLTPNPLHRRNALDRIKKRAQACGIDLDICNHTFRATGITTYLSNGGALETAQQIAAHESPTTTKLYDRRSDVISLNEIEWIVI
jgi:integrase